MTDYERGWRDAIEKAAHACDDYSQAGAKYATRIRAIKSDDWHSPVDRDEFEALQRRVGILETYGGQTVPLCGQRYLGQQCRLRWSPSDTHVHEFEPMHGTEGK